MNPEGASSAGGEASELPGDVNEPDDTAAFEPVELELGVPIGGVKSLGSATKEGGTVSIPFLGQYINAVYRYLAGIALIAAIIMVVYGGFRYLVGSTTGDIARGKQIILDALMGMLITLSAYAILNMVNPATLRIGSISLTSVDRDAVVMGETGIDFGDSGDSNYTPPIAGSPYPSSELASLEMCGQLRPFIDDGTLVLRNPNDRSGLLGGTGFIRRPNGSEWCQLADSRRTEPTCSTLPTISDLEEATGGNAVTFDDGAEGVPIHPMLCRYLLDLARAKSNGLISGTLTATIVGRHHRCADGAWYFRSATSNANCSTLTTGRQECIQCVERIVAGDIASSRQSNHWSGQAFDLVQNNDIQRYTINTLAPQYREQNGGEPVFNDVFGGVIEPSEGTVNCSTRAGRIRTKSYCVNGRCGSTSEFVSVGMSEVCGHYSGGTNSHIHVSFY